jgi:hypothetical protein
MTKAELARRLAWRFKVIQQAGERSRIARDQGQPPHLACGRTVTPRRRVARIEHALKVPTRLFRAAL